jgi:hypothetical protein
LLIVILLSFWLLRALLSGGVRWSRADRSPSEPET